MGCKKYLGIEKDFLQPTLTSFISENTFYLYLSKLIVFPFTISVSSSNLIEFAERKPLHY